MLDAPVTSRATKATGSRRAPGGPSQLRDGGEGFARRAYSAGSATELGAGHQASDVPRYAAPRRYGGVRLRLRGGLPRSVTGRVVTGAVLFAGLCGFTAALWAAQRFLLHDPRLIIQSSSSVQITGNEHLSRPQLLSIFGEDVERNILTVPLAERHAELESLPWVEHAIVMRLLPNRIRVAIVERTPVAFVRQGSHIGLVDAGGVLLDMSADVDRAHPYSFPVLTGISAADPLSTRAARMKLFLKFIAALDAGTAGEDRPSKTLSEVDLSNPEDVKALIPNGSSDILVHFGEEDFLARYQRYEKNLPGWKAQYAKLASVDMRYERQVVLEMQAGTSVPIPETVSDSGDMSAKATKISAKNLVRKPTAVPAAKLKAAGAKPQATPGVRAQRTPSGHLEKSFSVHPNAGEPIGKTHTPPVGPQ